MSYAHFSPASEAAYIIQTEGKTMVNAFEFFFFLKSVTTGVSAKSTQKKKKKRVSKSIPFLYCWRWRSSAILKVINVV